MIQPRNFHPLPAANCTETPDFPVEPAARRTVAEAPCEGDPRDALGPRDWARIRHALRCYEHHAGFRSTLEKIEALVS